MIGRLSSSTAGLPVMLALLVTLGGGPVPGSGRGGEVGYVDLTALHAYDLGAPRQPALQLAASASVSRELASLLAASDSAYAALDLDRALELAGAAMAQDTTSGAASWRLARVLLDLSDETAGRADRRTDAEASKGTGEGARKNPGDKVANHTEQRRLIEEALEQARRAARLDPEAPWGYLYEAIAAGKLALLEGGRTKIRLGQEVRDSARQALARDPRNDLALDVLGQWHREVATLSPLLKVAARVMYGGIPAGASLDSSTILLERAVAIAPHRIRHRVALGVTEIALARYPAAIAQLDTALALPRHDPGDIQLQSQATELLERAHRLLSRPRRDVSR